MDHGTALLVSSYWYELARWELAVSMARDRVRQAISEYLAFEDSGLHQGESKYHMTLMIEIHFLFVAVAHLYKVARRIRDLTEKPEIARAIGKFEGTLSDAKTLRDLLEHAGDYMEGKGKLEVPWPDGARIGMANSPELEVAVMLGDESTGEAHISAIEAADAALSLASDLPEAAD